MEEYHVDNLKTLSAYHLAVFGQIQDNQYESLIIDNGYTSKWSRKKLGFIFERDDQWINRKESMTMSVFKRTIQYMNIVRKYYEIGEKKENDTDMIIPVSEQIYIKAQLPKDLKQTKYDGAHCSLHLKLVGFRMKSE